MYLPHCERCVCFFFEFFLNFLKQHRWKPVATTKVTTTTNTSRQQQQQQQPVNGRQSLDDRVARLEATLTGLSEQLQVKEEKLVSSDETVATLESKMRLAEQERLALESKLRASEQERDRLQLAQQRSMADLKSQEHRYRMLEQQHAELGVTLRTLQQEQLDLEHRYQTLDQQHGELSSTFKKLQHGHQELSSSHSRLQADHDSLRSHCTQLEVAKSDLDQQLRAGELERRRLHEAMQDLRGNIRVLCRLKPMIGAHRPVEIEVVGKRELTISSSEESLSVSGASKAKPVHTFAFDRVFDGHCSQAMCFEEISMVSSSSS